MPQNNYDLALLMASVGKVCLAYSVPPYVLGYQRDASDEFKQAAFRDVEPFLLAQQRLGPCTPEQAILRFQGSVVAALTATFPDTEACRCLLNGSAEWLRSLRDYRWKQPV